MLLDRKGDLAVIAITQIVGIGDHVIEQLHEIHALDLSDFYRKPRHRRFPRPIECRMVRKCADGAGSEYAQRISRARYFPYEDSANSVTPL